MTEETQDQSAATQAEPAPTVGQALDTKIAAIKAERDAARQAFTQADADFNTLIGELETKRETFAAWIDHEVHAAEQAVIDFFKTL